MPRLGSDISKVIANFNQLLLRQDSKKLYDSNQKIISGEKMVDIRKITGILLIIIAIVILIWPYLVAQAVLEIIKWIVVIVLVIVGIGLILKPGY